MSIPSSSRDWLAPMLTGWAIDAMIIASAAARITPGRSLSQTRNPTGAETRGTSVPMRTRGVRRSSPSVPRQNTRGTSRRASSHHFCCHWEWVQTPLRAKTGYASAAAPTKMVSTASTASRDARRLALTACSLVRLPTEYQRD